MGRDAYAELLFGWTTEEDPAGDFEELVDLEEDRLRGQGRRIDDPWAQVGPGLAFPTYELAKADPDWCGAHEAYTAERRRIEESIPVEVFTGSFDDFNGGVKLKGRGAGTDWDSPAEVDLISLETGFDYDDVRLAVRWCRERGIPVPADGPRWLLVASFG